MSFGILLERRLPQMVRTLVFFSLNESLDQVPFNAVGPTNSSKKKSIVENLSYEFRGKFYEVFLLCPTFTFNETNPGSAEEDRFLRLDPRLNGPYR